jgi:hypothetical protein
MEVVNQTILGARVESKSYYKENVTVSKRFMRGSNEMLKHNFVSVRVKYVK